MPCLVRNVHFFGQAHEKAVTSLVFVSENGLIFASGSEDGNIHIWKIHVPDTQTAVIK